MLARLRLEPVRGFLAISAIWGSYQLRWLPTVPWRGARRLAEVPARSGEVGARSAAVRCGAERCGGLLAAVVPGPPATRRTGRRKSLQVRGHALNTQGSERHCVDERVIGIARVGQIAAAST